MSTVLFAFILLSFGRSTLLRKGIPKMMREEDWAPTLRPRWPGEYMRYANTVEKSLLIFYWVLASVECAYDPFHWSRNHIKLGKLKGLLLERYFVEKEQLLGKVSAPNALVEDTSFAEYATARKACK